MRLVLDDHPGTFDDVAVQFSFTGAVATHRIEVHAGFDHVRGQDGRAGFVGSDGGNNVSAAHRISHAGGNNELQVRVSGQVLHQLFGSRRVDVEQADFVDIEQGMECQGLKLTLRTIANQRHAACVITCQVAGHERRSSSCTDRGSEGHFTQQHRLAGIHIAQGTECHHREHSGLGILGVTVDVFEGIQRGIGSRHQLNHAVCRVIGQACALFEIIPAQIVLANVFGHFAEAGGQAFAYYQLAQIMDVDVTGHGKSLLL